MANTIGVTIVLKEVNRVTKNFCLYDPWEKKCPKGHAEGHNLTPEGHDPLLRVVTLYGDICPSQKSLMTLYPKP